jgi:hypothetical protein
MYPILEPIWTVSSQGPSCTLARSCLPMTPPWPHLYGASLLYGMLPCPSGLGSHTSHPQSLCWSLQVWEITLSSLLSAINLWGRPTWHLPSHAGLTCLCLTSAMSLYQLGSYAAPIQGPHVGWLSNMCGQIWWILYLTPSNFPWSYLQTNPRTMLCYERKCTLISKSMGNKNSKRDSD